MPSLASSRPIRHARLTTDALGCCRGFRSVSTLHSTPTCVMSHLPAAIFDVHRHRPQTVLQLSESRAAGIGSAVDLFAAGEPGEEAVELQMRQSGDVGIGPRLEQAAESRAQLASECE